MEKEMEGEVISVEKLRREYWNLLQREAKEKETTVYSSVFTPLAADAEGESLSQYFIAGNNFGFLNLWALSHILESKGENSHLPRTAFRAHSGAIYSMTLARDNLLITAGDDALIRVWKWPTFLHSSTTNENGTTSADVKKKKKYKGAESTGQASAPLLELHTAQQHPASTGLLAERFETNGLCADKKEPYLYSASGDNNAYMWDLNTGQCIGRFQGHTDYLHCITQRGNRQVVTGSEDGTVRFWDPRSFQTVNKVNPSQDARKGLEKQTNTGKWVSCVAIDPEDNWMVCGGGGGHFLSLYHLASLEATSYLPMSGMPQAATFTPGGSIISVGNEQFVSHWKKNGKLVMKVPSSSRSLFSISLAGETQEIIAATGVSPYVDVFTNFGKTSRQLQFSSCSIQSE